MMSKKPVTKMGKGATLISENTAVTGDVRFSDQLPSSTATLKVMCSPRRARTQR